MQERRRYHDRRATESRRSLRHQFRGVVPHEELELLPQRSFDRPGTPLTGHLQFALLLERARRKVQPNAALLGSLR